MQSRTAWLIFAKTKVIDFYASFFRNVIFYLIVLYRDKQGITKNRPMHLDIELHSYEIVDVIDF